MRSRLLTYFLTRTPVCWKADATQVATSQSYILIQRRRSWGGACAPPPSFGISVYPIQTKGGRLCPPYYYVPPYLFGRCGISVIFQQFTVQLCSCAKVRSCAVQKSSAFFMYVQQIKVQDFQHCSSLHKYELNIHLCTLYITNYNQFQYDQWH